MLSFTDIKYWMRSGSIRFMRNRKSAAKSSLASVTWKGHPIFYRPGTSDLTLIYRVLLKPERKQEYQVPKGLQPRVILDIGANIGVTSALLAHQFPTARILSFEPAPENVDVLRKNASSFANIQVFPVGLGKADGQLDLYFSDDDTNFGGYSLYAPGTNPSRHVPIQIREINSLLREAKIDQIDLIKIDTEGAEYDILTQLDRNLLQRVTWVTGELHGQRDFDLLAYLSEWFDIKIDKALESRLSVFEARNKQKDK